MGRRGPAAFEQLQHRLQRRGAQADRAAGEWPAHFVAFDLLRLSGTDTSSWPYCRRRAALDSVFADRQLSEPWVLSPTTTEADTVREWLTWSSVGMEGVVFKMLEGAYRPSERGWLKYKPRETTEAIVGAVTGTLAAPRTLLLGRYDDTGHLQYTGGTTTLTQTASSTVAALIALAQPGHPWTGRSFSAGWGSREKLDIILVNPTLRVEVGVDVARYAADRWRHPARFHRARPDLTPTGGRRRTGGGTRRPRGRG
ncbi:ATP-dependent DNA ligase [Streptomyces sp. NBC_00289]|uniref:ATP-dependent DNA ligase n=1 Tax=Streptomyces sp. NBC_00289 TaxID=2975703 RepID=UPI0032556053